MSKLTELNLDQIKLKALRKMLADDLLFPSITPSTALPGFVLVSMTVILSDKDLNEEVKS